MGFRRDYHATMTKDQVLRLLRGGPEGIDKWNHWRSENPNAEIPDLKQADLGGVHLEGANLANINLERANLFQAHLEKAVLRKAHLEGACLFGAYLEKADLSEAHLEGSELLDADLRNANLFNAHLERANLGDADFEGRELAYPEDVKSTVELIGGPILYPNVEARLDGTYLRGAHLEETAFLVRGGDSHLWDSLWPFFPIPYKLDRTHTRNTRFHPRARDPWSILRRYYTGTNMVFVLLFTLVAFSPVIAKTTFWSTVSRWQQSAAPAAVDAIQRTAEFLATTPDPAWVQWVEKANAFLSSVERERMTFPQLRETLELLDSGGRAIEAFRDRASENASELEELREIESWVTRVQEAIRILAQDSEIRLQERRVLSLVLGTEDGWHIAMFSAMLLLYPVARTFLTYHVGPLREDEERVGVSPAWKDYRPLWRLHQVTSPLLVVSVLFGMMRIVGALWGKVLVG